MDSSASVPQIKCDLHNNDVIVRVSKNPHSDKLLYCIECILETEGTAKKNLVPLKNFLDEAYEKAKSEQTIKIQSAPPVDLVRILNNQDQLVNQFGEHLNKVKNQVFDKLDAVKEEICKAVDNHKERIEQKLKGEVEAYRGNFTEYRKTIQKFFRQTKAEHEELAKSDFYNSFNTNSYKDLENKIKNTLIEMQSKVSYENIDDQDIHNYLDKCKMHLLKQLEKLPKWHDTKLISDPKTLEGVKTNLDSVLVSMTQIDSKVLPLPSMSKFIENHDLEKTLQFIDPIMRKSDVRMNCVYSETSKNIEWEKLISTYLTTPNSAMFVTFEGKQYGCFKSESLDPSRINNIQTFSFCPNIDEKNCFTTQFNIWWPEIFRFRAANDFVLEKQLGGPIQFAWRDTKGIVEEVEIFEAELPKKQIQYSDKSAELTSLKMNYSSQSLPKNKENLSIISITASPQNVEKKTLDEIRIEDYMALKKGIKDETLEMLKTKWMVDVADTKEDKHYKNQSGGTSSAFGKSSFGGGGFGSNSGGFGSGGFGNNAGGGFGSGGFGNNSGGGFGSGGFGSNSGGFGSGGFGNSSSSGFGGFGSNNNNNQGGSLFGNSGGLFSGGNNDNNNNSGSSFNFGGFGKSDQDKKESPKKSDDDTKEKPKEETSKKEESSPFTFSPATGGLFSSNNNSESLFSGASGLFGGGDKKESGGLFSNPPKKEGDEKSDAEKAQENKGED